MPIERKHSDTSYCNAISTVAGSQSGENGAQRSAVHLSIIRVNESGSNSLLYTYFDIPKHFN